MWSYYISSHGQFYLYANYFIPALRTWLFVKKSNISCVRCWSLRPFDSNQKAIRDSGYYFFKRPPFEDVFHLQNETLNMRQRFEKKLCCNELLKILTFINKLQCKHFIFRPAKGLARPLVSLVAEDEPLSSLFMFTFSFASFFLCVFFPSCLFFPFFLNVFFFHIFFLFASFSTYRRNPDRPESCASHSESLISLSYSMPAFSANSFGLF